MQIHNSSSPPLGQDVSSFHENGYIIAPAVYTPEEMAACKRSAQELTESQSGPSGVFVWMCDTIPSLFEGIACHSRLMAILQVVIGPRIEFLSAKPVFKSAQVNFPSPWHQDQAYWGGAPKYSAWIALEDATLENGCLKVIPGSHRSALDHAAVQDKIGFGNRILDEDLKNETIVDAPLNAGDALIFHDCLLHSSHPNLSGRDRWSFIPTYRNADLPDPSTAWSTSKHIAPCDPNHNS